MRLSELGYLMSHCQCAIDHVRNDLHRKVVIRTFLCITDSLCTELCIPRWRNELASLPERDSDSACGNGRKWYTEIRIPNSQMLNLDA
jgi:hypothetical protein